MLATALDPGATEQPKSERLRLAIEEFYARSTRRSHPEGGWRNSLWYPSAAERQTCCEGIEPSIENRQALESHCRTQGHVAVRYGLPVLRPRWTTTPSPGSHWASGPVTLFSATLLTCRMRSGIGMSSPYLRNDEVRLTRCGHGDL